MKIQQLDDRVIVTPSQTYVRGAVLAALCGIGGAVHALIHTEPLGDTLFGILWVAVSVGIGRQLVIAARQPGLEVVEGDVAGCFSRREVIRSDDIKALLLITRAAWHSDEYDMIEVYLQLRSSADRRFIYQAYAQHRSKAYEVAASLASRWRVPVCDDSKA